VVLTDDATGRRLRRGRGTAVARVTRDVSRPVVATDAAVRWADTDTIASFLNIRRERRASPQGVNLSHENIIANARAVLVKRASGKATRKTAFVACAASRQALLAYYLLPSIGGVHNESGCRHSTSAADPPVAADHHLRTRDLCLLSSNFGFE